MSRAIRPSRTSSTGALFAKSLLNAALFFAIFMVALPCLAHRLLPLPLPLPAFLRTTIALFVCAGGLAVWGHCLCLFSREGRGTPFPLDAPSRLVTTGPFALTRNPIMAAEIAVIWGEALYFASLGLLLYAAAIAAAAHVLVVRVEEPELRERFGETYESYRDRVPRWLPGRRLTPPRV